LAFSYWTIKPWFLTEGKTCCYIHQTFSWGFPTGRLFTAPSIAIINLAVTSPPAATKYLHWSEQLIEFSREDHPITVPRPGNTPLVLKAQIGTYDVDRIFMDAGSGINLIYAKTLRAMHISLEFLKPTDCSFHGIVPGSANYPLGWIALNVCFGNRQNYRREKLDFEVMDWPSQYHAILG
jgi:hypothetical protein